jgi:hypothetical protein
VNRFYDALYPALPIFAQSLVITAGGYARYRARFNRHFQKTLNEWESTVDGPLENLHEIQRRRLDRLVERAREHVPYYRDLPPPSDHRDPVEAMERTLAAIPPPKKSHELIARPTPSSIRAGSQTCPASARCPTPTRGLI